MGWLGLAPALAQRHYKLRCKCGFKKRKRTKGCDEDNRKDNYTTGENKEGEKEKEHLRKTQLREGRNHDGNNKHVVFALHCTQREDEQTMI